MPAQSSTKKTDDGTDIPVGAKQPTDRKPKAKDDNVIKITVRGIELEVLKDALDDFELLDDLNELEQNENPARLPSVLRRLIGSQWKMAMNSLRGENGRVSVEDGAEFVGEILEAVSPS